MEGGTRREQLILLNQTTRCRRRVLLFRRPLMLRILRSRLLFVKDVAANSGNWLLAFRPAGLYVARVVMHRAIEYRRLATKINRLCNLSRQTPLAALGMRNDIEFSP